ncbi:tyrosine-type recombinase/integrase [Candidatus Omnitrophota bacterium]
MIKRTKGIKHIKGSVYQIDYQICGTRKQCRIRADSLKEAKIMRQERIVELRKRLPTIDEDKTRLNASFDEVWEILEKDLLSDDICRKQYLRYKRVFWRIFGEFRSKKFPHIESVSGVTLPFFLEYKAYYTTTLNLDPRGGWRAELVCLKAMMRRLKKLGYCDKNILEDLKEIKKPKAIKKDYPKMNNTQLKLLLNFIKQDRPDFYPPLYFMSRTGRRVAETTLIKRKDIEWKSLEPVKIHIRGEITKTGEDAPLERLDDDLKKVIKDAYRISKVNKSPYLFLNRTGKKCGPNKIRDFLKATSKEKTGIEITPHFFRHRFLTECGNAKVSIPDMMKIAGIKNLDVVMNHYSHSTDEGQDKVLAVSKV